MKLRILKKYAKARHTYGLSRQGLKLEMDELRGYPWLMKHTSLRFWTKHWYCSRKCFKKHTGFGKRDYYGFYFLVPHDTGRKIIETRKRQEYE